MPGGATDHYAASSGVLSVLQNARAIECIARDMPAQVRAQCVVNLLPINSLAVDALTDARHFRRAQRVDPVAGLLLSVHTKGPEKSWGTVEPRAAVAHADEQIPIH